MEAEVLEAASSVRLSLLLGAAATFLKKKKKNIIKFFYNKHQIAPNFSRMTCF
jgi:hypothetical protein